MSKVLYKNGVYTLSPAATGDGGTLLLSNDMALADGVAALQTSIGSINTTLSGMGLIPQFVISGSTMTFTNVPTGATLNIYKYTRHKAGVNKNKKTSRVVNPRLGKRFYLLKTIASFSGSWSTTSLASYAPKSTQAIKHGMLKFSYTVNGVEHPMSHTVKVTIKTNGTRINFC